MQLGAAFAGTAIENTMLGAAHSAANPLTAHYGMVHGQAVGLMLPGVIAFNARDPDAHDRYLELAAIAGLSSVEELIGEIETILDTARMRIGLEEVRNQEQRNFPSSPRKRRSNGPRVSIRARSMRRISSSFTRRFSHEDDRVFASCVRASRLRRLADAPRRTAASRSGADAGAGEAGSTVDVQRRQTDQGRRGHRGVARFRRG